MTNTAKSEFCIIPDFSTALATSALHDTNIVRLLLLSCAATRQRPLGLHKPTPNGRRVQTLTMAVVGNLPRPEAWVCWWMCVRVRVSGCVSVWVCQRARPWAD
jgi:hypothetical protein